MEFNGDFMIKQNSLIFKSVSPEVQSRIQWGFEHDCFKTGSGEKLMMFPKEWMNIHNKKIFVTHS